MAGAEYDVTLRVAGEVRTKPFACEATARVEGRVYKISGLRDRRAKLIEALDLPGVIDGVIQGEALPTPQLIALRGELRLRSSTVPLSGS